MDLVLQFLSETTLYLGTIGVVVIIGYYYGYYSLLLLVARMSILDTKVDGSIPSINMFSP